MEGDINVINERLSGRYGHTDIVVANAAGATIEAVGRGSYVDYILGNLTQLRGFRSIASLCEKLADISTPSNVGDNPHEIQNQLAGKLLAIARKECLRFTNSGSEAVHLAIRVARAHTGRKKILRFFGHYHGWYSEEIFGFLPAKYSDGLAEEAAANTLSIEWNDLDALKDAFERHGDQIACVICEPVLAHSGTIPAKEGFLEAMVALAKQHGSLSIFDECVTGFRVGLHGAQGLYGVYADMVVYSKAISGGVPFGVLLGKAKHFAPLSEGRVFHASTYDGNILSALACLEVLSELEQGETYRLIEHAQDKLVDGIRTIVLRSGLPCHVQSVPGFFQVYFTAANDVDSYSAAMATDYQLYRRFVAGMRANHVLISEGDLSHADPRQNWLGSWFLSSAHDDKAIGKTLDACEKSLRELLA
ncbi:aminotransferase class III-fold pyridoxal phosphate-dependent enzyme [Mesorhizobium sp.]|uniref:aspartate aminotransferase family protein n=1 Tax=Mesorhizobium sp. TaxID=1871066 RepID=UPI000FE74830|nr:aminotransferase class III-fold pyridoxal phosphate-dependent enzyme [Mesorhizobium sp.]RWM21656.1 MAG: aminotransferase class III-fold pyridoxal phosphate-dependent enzyme [Mesorhizobium sp.]RWM41042.1 MAG: aminotransferase class III-fold pyridoxal phosphate-dependent enzyme [Mesorhizobium sp.]TIO73762.1 MAG: aminotransferase class III-fold pyridoxal phosphate-dependent enzyme [Mesorhizobium sp.]TIO82918.1 MAG: aminotransferase class III-fold pyridoxal phosphate-dependent enzyme [Mesorhizob